MVSRSEAKTRPELTHSRYALLTTNETSLTAEQPEKLAWSTRLSLQLETARAPRSLYDSVELYNKARFEGEEAQLRRWRYGAKRSRLDPVKAFVGTVEDHSDGIPA